MRGSENDERQKTLFYGKLFRRIFSPRFCHGDAGVTRAIPDGDFPAGKIKFFAFGRHYPSPLSRSGFERGWEMLSAGRSIESMATDALKKICMREWLAAGKFRLRDGEYSLHLILCKPVPAFL